MADEKRRGLWARLRAFHWGEAGLWVAFLIMALASADGSGSDRESLATLAGIFALAAIGVRATRPAVIERDDG